MSKKNTKNTKIDHIVNRRCPKAATKGFTLVELVVVIVVIAILASISVLIYQGIQNRAKTTVYAVTAKQVQSSLQIALLRDPSILKDGATCIGSLEDYPAVGVFEEGECSVFDPNGSRSSSQYSEHEMSKIRNANSDIQIPSDLPTVKVGGIDYSKDYWMRGFLASRIGDLVVLQWATPDSSSCAGGTNVGEGFRDSLQETLEDANIKIDDLRDIVNGRKTISSVFGTNSGVDMEDVRRLVEYLDNQTNSCWLILDT